MPRYERIAPFLPYVVLAVLILAGYLWYVGDQIGAQPRTRETGQPQVGGAFALVDQDGKARTDADYRGHYMLVFFGYTNCPDVCPTTLAVMSAALDMIGKQADNITPIFVTIDPAHDTPQVLKSYLAAFGPRFVGLSGTDEQIAAAAKAYRVYYQRHPLDGGGYTMDHSSIIYFMAPDGSYRANFTLEQGPEQLAKHLQDQMARR